MKLLEFQVNSATHLSSGNDEEIMADQPEFGCLLLCLYP